MYVPKKTTDNNPKEEDLTQSSSSPSLKNRACPTTG